MKKKIDLESLNKYLTYEYVPTPNSIFQNVYKLEPGHYLKYDGKNIKKECFWDIKFEEKSKDYNFNDIVERLDDKIDKAVKERLMSDVPLGVFLSGGIDSSAICYYAQKNSKQKIKTFSIGFGEQSFDESKYARLVAKYLKTEHHEKILSASDLLELIPKIADLLDEPLADASIVPTYLLSQFAREHVTVSLAGDGGDELFCGYDTFRAHKFAEVYEKIPEWLRKKIIEKIVLSLPTSFKNISFDFAAKSFVKGFYGEKKYRDQRWLGSFTSAQKKKLFLPHVLNKINAENEFNDIDNYLKNVKGENFYNQLIYLYLRMYLMDDILVKADRASMYNSLEVRTPLIDYKVVDFVNNIPMDFKIKGLKTKYIFKKLMEDKLPKEIINRPKKGFGIPMAEWLTKELKPLALKLLSREKLVKQGLFDYNYINRLLNDHFLKKKDNRKLIWTLMVFQMWWSKWLE
ncbi:MAG: asparagine synthase (glutamine-hydrolyzing) [Patescibacteria group bacterium]